MKIKYHLNDCPSISIQLNWNEPVFYYPACPIVSQTIIGYFKVNNEYELGKLYWEGALELPFIQQPVQYPLCIEVKQPVAAYYPTVKNYDEISPLLNRGFFKPISAEQRIALREHNINNYKKSAKVLGYGPDVNCRALELMADEIEEMTAKGIAFQSES
ncbi:Uncharacterised protein [Legionella busanensis]|uniref:Uncharacterized protein n=1 Tax=Legionella busanensis TaxID=190655 RepID=A0A378JHA7_9GAMM|nr:hypothetical protein [Legionella busanensis]STX50514.1 Uncharacterised protein [Legionella busanensis]